MREQLLQYVNLLFAGAPDSDDIRQEILQNTLDRYDDLISQGKTPEAAYRLAISGIGDINEILNQEPEQPVFHDPAPARDIPTQEDDTAERKKARAFAIAFYIVSPIPMFILSEFGYATLGLCMTLLLVAAATALLIIYRKPDSEEFPTHTKSEPRSEPRQELKKSFGSLIWAIGIALYFILSFLTNAWYITWLLFPIIGCVEGLVNAIIDLKEASRYEI